MSSKKALVTGCAGFIGSHLTEELLTQGYTVIGVDCFTDYYSREIKENNLRGAMDHENFSFIEKDLLSMDCYPRVDYVFHQAAQAGVRASWGKSFSIYTRNNMEVTQRLLEFYKNSDIEKFVYASSSSVYGDTPDLPMCEDSLLRPVSPYGVTKLAGENLCYLYFKNYVVPVVSLRYFTVYGPRQRLDMGINRFVKAIHGGDEITIYGDGNQTRDFTFISDAVKANILAGESDVTGEVFNVGGGSRISVNDLIREIEEIVGNEARIRFAEDQKGDMRDTCADISKANEMLGWFSKVDIKSGLKRYIDWYLDMS